MGRCTSAHARSHRTTYDRVCGGLVSRRLTVESVRLAGVTLPPLLAVVLVLLTLEIVLANTRFRTLP